ncbi:MAG TPA: XdhC family protein [Lacunisphaera sp.]|jgi:xanthine/CO dehydrogenase XdhC/CoxF family maturation factor
MSEINSILSALAENPSKAAVLATLVSVEGSSYRRPGARLLVLSGGSRVGSISGGCLEDDIILRSNHVLRSGRSEIVTYDTTGENDIVWGVGLGCRGVVSIFVEPIPVTRPGWISVLRKNQAAREDTRLVVAFDAAFAERRGTYVEGDAPLVSGAPRIFEQLIVPPPSLILFGAGDDAQPLVRLAHEVDWHVTVVDSRAAYATAARFPAADAVVVATPEEMDGQLKLDEESFAVLMTHRFAEDEKLLRKLLPRPLAYLGVLGPRQRTDRLLAQLAAERLAANPDTLKRLCAPVGLDLGSTTPETIALSILSEMQCALTGRTPIHLRDRNAPIHG